MTNSEALDVRYLARPEGRIAYTVEGTGPLVVAVPGMGDLRSTFRELTGPLVAAGCRVAAMDLRGAGDSDTTFHEHGDVVTAQDLLALIEELGGPAIVLGNSMGGSAAILAAAEDPSAVVGMVLFGAFFREPPASTASRVFTHLLYRILVRKPWGPGFWANYYTKLNVGTAAPWLGEHTKEIRDNLREPGRLRSFRELTLQLDHTPVEGRVGRVRAPMRAFFGEKDPDFADPRAESDWAASKGARSEIVPSAGHYAQAQRPDIVVPATLAFIGELRDADGGWRRPEAGSSRA